MKRHGRTPFVFVLTRFQVDDKTRKTILPSRDLFFLFLKGSLRKNHTSLLENCNFHINKERMGDVYYCGKTKWKQFGFRFREQHHTNQLRATKNFETWCHEVSQLHESFFINSKRNQAKCCKMWKGKEGQGWRTYCYQSD